MSWTLDPLQNRLMAQTYNGVLTAIITPATPTPAWTSASSTAWTRCLTGPNGGLAATQTQDGSITLQLSNLHGDIVATAQGSISASGSLTYSESTEFGAPRAPATGYRPYGYLGTAQRSDAQLAGLTAMGVRLYNSATGRCLVALDREDPDPQHSTTTRRIPHPRSTPTRSTTPSDEEPD